MSELSIALVAEGTTDYIIIEAVLRAILPNPFILTKLQPEATNPQFGEGWGGVVKWCHAVSMRGQSSLDSDPLLEHFDFIIIHLDVDVCHSTYQDCGSRIAELSQQHHWAPLPCAQPCPPVTHSVHALQLVLRSWLSPTQAGTNTIFCLPAQSTGTWLAAALFTQQDPLLVNAECDRNLENSLARLPLAQRVKKVQRTTVKKRH